MKTIAPRIEILNETKLMGVKITMSYANDKTVQLWKSFSPRRQEMKNSISTNLYSVEWYNNTSFFKNFNPMAEFEKWAAVEVKDFDFIPDDMETLVLSEGEYAVFAYKGKPSEAKEMFLFIYGEWLPNSVYELDNRPHFALMGANYKGEDPESEEDFWIPIKKK